MLRELKCVQPKTRCIPFRVTYSAGTPSVAEGSKHLTVSDTGVGIATLAFVTGFARAPVILLTGVIANTGDEAIADLRAPTATGFIVETSDAAGTLADRDFHGFVIGFDSPDEA